MQNREFFIENKRKSIEVNCPQYYTLMFCQPNGDISLDNPIIIDIRQRHTAHQISSMSWGSAVMLLYVSACSLLYLVSSLTFVLQSTLDAWERNHLLICLGQLPPMMRRDVRQKMVKPHLNDITFATGPEPDLKSFPYLNICSLKCKSCMVKSASPYAL